MTKFSNETKVTDLKQGRKTVDLDPGLYKKIAIIAAVVEVKPIDWINNALRPIVDVAYPEALKTLCDPDPFEGAAGGKKKPAKE